jgi:hypothetical protein
MHTDSGFAGEATSSKSAVFQPVPKETIRSRCQYEKKSVCIAFLIGDKKFLANATAMLDLPL